MADVADTLPARHHGRAQPALPGAAGGVHEGKSGGASEGGCCWIGYVIHHAPGPMLAVQPSVELAKRFSQQRIDPLIEESPAFEKVAPARSRDSGNTVLSKEFPGGILVMTGANSAVGLRSMPVRILFLDEVDAYPPFGLIDEGDPVALAEARTRTFSWRRKVFLASTPTIKGLSRIEREYEASDQRRFFVPCPHCGRRQFWVRALALAEGQAGDRGLLLRELRDPDRRALQDEDAGERRTAADGRLRRSVHHRLPSLQPVFASGLAVVGADRAEAEACQTAVEAKRSFINTVLGESWVETGEAPDWQRLYDRRHDYRLGSVPAGGLLLTAGADVQRDRIEVSIWAWGRGLTSWLIDHVVIEGGPEKAHAWAALTELLGFSWPHEAGTEMGSRGLRSTPATRRRRSMPGPGGWAEPRWSRSRVSTASTGRRR